MTAPARVVRNRLTLQMYAVNGASAFFFYSVGPATPLIAEDLGISAQAVALHGTAMAAAMLTVGVVTAPAVARFGRRSTIVSCLLVMALGILGVVLAPTLVVSLIGTYFAGTSGSVAVAAANAELTVLHPDVAPAALTEGSAAAAWVGLLSPLLMGGFLAIGLGWRVGLSVAIPLAVLLALSLRGRSAAHGAWEDAGAHGEHGPADVIAGPMDAVPAERPDASDPLHPPDPLTGGRGFPRQIWVVMVAVFATAGAELAVSYWGATLLRENLGAAPGTATAAMSAAVAGVAIGRTFGARLALRLPAHGLLVGGWLLAAAGFFLFWTAGSVPIAVLGLLVTGMGLSVTFPLLLDRAVLVMPDRPDRALSTAMAFVGLASGIGPFVLGALAAQVGVGSAFLLVPGFMALGMGAVLASRPPDDLSTSARA